MELNWWKEDGRQRRWLLELGDGTCFTRADLSESGIKLQEAVDAGEDFTVGGTCCGVLQFELKDFDGSLPDLTGGELTLYAGIEAGRTVDKSAARAVRSRVICRHGDAVYGGFDRAPYLRVWREQNGTLVRQDDPAQPERPVGAVLVAGDRLYCCHEEAPWLTAYTLPGLEPAALPALSAFAQSKATWYAQHRLSLNRQGERVSEFTVTLRDMQPQELVETVFELARVGIYTMEKPEEKNVTLAAVTAYDRMSLFDRNIDGWLAGLEDRFDRGEQIPLYALLQSLCAYCGVELATASIRNGGYLIRHNFSARDLTGRRVLQWIAKASASFARMTPAGELELGWYAGREYALGPGDLSAMNLAKYRTSPVARLQVRSSENDIGVIVPADAAGGNGYVIEDNPLLYADTDAELRPAAQAIYDAIKAHAYRPCMLQLQRSNPLLHAGDAVTLSLPDGGSETVYIMSRTMEETRDKLVSTGNQERAVQARGTHYLIQRLRGSANELSRTIEETKSTLTNYQTQTDGTLQTLQTSITQNAREIALKASQTEVNALGSRLSSAEASIVVNANAITQKVAKTDFDQLGNRVTNAESSIVVNATSITTKVAQTEYDSNNQAIASRFSKLEQTANALTATVGDGTRGLVAQVTLQAAQIQSKVEANGVISAINQSPESVTINASKINLSGYVTISSLQQSGQTIINADNITTGRINAALISSGTLEGVELWINGSGGRCYLGNGQVQVGNQSHYFGYLTYTGGKGALWTSGFISTDGWLSTGSYISCGGNLRVTGSTTLGSLSCSSLTLGTSSISKKNKSVVTSVTFNKTLQTISAPTETIYYLG